MLLLLWRFVVSQFAEIFIRQYQFLSTGDTNKYSEPSINKIECLAQALDSYRSQNPKFHFQLSIRYFTMTCLQKVAKCRDVYSIHNFCFSASHKSQYLTLPGGLFYHLNLDRIISISIHQTFIICIRPRIGWDPDAVKTRQRCVLQGVPKKNALLCLKGPRGLKI